MPSQNLMFLGLQDLFMDNAEYDHWCSIGGGNAQERLKFMAFAKLSRCAFVLVCGVSHAVTS